MVLLVVFFTGFYLLPGQSEDKEELSRRYCLMDIKRIWMEKMDIIDKKVIIHGEYRGWRDEVPGPLITRSDWVVRDSTGAIYVTGKCPGNLDPVKDIGNKIVVKGVIKISKDGIPYVRAEEVKGKQKRRGGQ